LAGGTLIHSLLGKAIRNVSMKQTVPSFMLLGPFFRPLDSGRSTSNTGREADSICREVGHLRSFAPTAGSSMLLLFSFVQLPKCSFFAGDVVQVTWLACEASMAESHGFSRLRLRGTLAVCSPSRPSHRFWALEDRGVNRGPLAVNMTRSSIRVAWASRLVANSSWFDANGHAKR
jgi:hypothetical protein